MAAEQNINNIHDFIALATETRNRWFPNEQTWGPWFRGLKQAKYELVPKVYRYCSDARPLDDNGRNLEDELRQEFTMRAPSFTSIQPQNKWDWYFLMQHSGAPTRLLDWTEGALIALYFALRDHDGISDAAVWMIEPWWLNKAVIGVGEVVPPGARIGMLDADAERYDPWLPARFEKVALPEQAVAIYPSHAVPRISTQRSCFTIHGSDRDWLEKFSSQPDAKLSKIIIPASSVREMSRQLVLCGVDEVTIYPDLDGLGRFLTSVLKQETGENDKGDIWKVR